MSEIIKLGNVMKLDGRLGYFGWPTVGKLDDNTYVCVSSGYRMTHVCPFGRVVASYSKDGIKWTPPGVIFDSGLDNRDAGIIQLKNKKILLTTFTTTWDFLKGSVRDMDINENLKGIVKEYIDSTDPMLYEKYYGSLILFSDNGINFDNMVKVNVSSPHGPIQLENGRLIYIGTPMVRTTENAEIELSYSDDNGLTWTYPTDLFTCEDGGEYCEPFAIEAEKDHIILLIRWEANDGDLGGVNKLLKVYQSDSYDGGKTFTQPHFVDIIGGPPHMVKDNNGDIILTYGRRKKPFCIGARISSDNGKTWGNEIILDDEMDIADFGYPSSVIMEDGNILTTYYFNKKSDKNASVRYVIWKK